MKQAELIVRRRNVNEFIRRLGEEVILSYRSRASDGAGGWVLGPSVERDPQVLRVINPATAVPGFLSADPPAAIMNNSDLVLVGSWDAIMAKDDEFMFQDESYKITRVSSRPDRVVAGATRE